MPLDPQAVSYLAQLRELGAQPASELPLETARSGYDAGAAALFGPPDDVASVEDLNAAECARSGLPPHGSRGWARGRLPTRRRLGGRWT